MHSQLYHDPPRTLAERLEQLNNHLQALGGRLKDALAGALSAAVAGAIRDAIRHLLGCRDGPSREYPLQQCADVLDSRDWSAREQPFQQRTDFDDGLWHEAQEPSWPPDHGFQPELQDCPENRDQTTTAKRWQNALDLAIDTTWWWLQQLPCRRPLLSTVTVAVAAGITAFLAGPTLAASVGVLATTASLFLTAHAASSASKQLALLVAG